MTIKQLIDRQLGPMPDKCFNKEKAELINGSFANYLMIKDKDSCQIYIANIFIKIEQSRRELLERLIEWCIYFGKLHTGWVMRDEWKEHIKYIEKTLSERTPITWEEIIKALEE